MAQFLFHRKYLGNDKKNNWNWEVTHHYLIFIFNYLIFFQTLLEIGSLFFIFHFFFNFIRNWFINAEILYSSLRLVFRCVKQYIN